MFVPRHVYGLFNCAVILNIHSKVIFREATFQSNTSKHTDWLAFLLTIMGEIIVIYGLKSVFWPMKSFLVYIYSMTFEVIQWQLPLALIKIAPCGRAHSVCVFLPSPRFFNRSGSFPAWHIVSYTEQPSHWVPGAVRLARGGTWSLCPKCRRGWVGTSASPKVTLLKALVNTEC